MIRAHTIDWMKIRDCCCDAGRTESDYAPGTFYPCVSCNPDWRRVPLIGPQPSLSFYFANPLRWTERWPERVIV